MLEAVGTALRLRCGRVEVDAAVGTAWLLEPDLAVACGHVVQHLADVPSGVARLVWGPHSVSGSLERLDTTTHVALLRLAGPLPGADPWTVAPARPGPCSFVYAGAPGPAREGTVVRVDPSVGRRPGRLLVYAPELAEAMLTTGHPYAGVPVLVDGAVVGHTVDAIEDPNDPTRSFLGLIDCAPAPVLDRPSADRPLPPAPGPAPGTEAAAHRPPPPPAPLRVLLSYRAVEARGGSDEDFAKSLFHRLGTFGIEAQLEPHILFGDPSPGAVKTAARSVRVAVLLHSAQWSREMDPLPVVEPLLRRARKKPEALTVAVGRLDEAPLPPALAGLPLIDLAPLRLSLDGRSAPSWGAVETLARSLRGLVTPDAPTSAAAPSAGPGTPAPDVAQRDVRGLVDTMLEDLTQVRRAGGGKKPSNPRSIHALALRWIETGLGGSDVPVEAARLLMAASDPERALEVLDEALEAADRGMEPRDLARLQRARGEALAELGRTDEALDALEALSRAEPLDAWTGGILAGVYKRQWLALGKRRRSLLLRAYQTYRDTYARTLHYYPGINAATLARLLGKEDEARALATRLRDRLSAENDLYFWDEATLGEAHLLLGDHDAAVRAYESAVVQALEQRNRRALVSMRRQIPLILEGSQDPSADDTARVLAQLFDVGHVGVFAGLRVQEGFPLERERWVRRALREALERHDIAVGCGCGEAGADLVCAELLLERSGEVEILLPYPRRLFRADLPDARWRERFDAVVGHERCSLIELSDTRPLDAAAARMHAAAAALDRAMELAGRREERATLIAFWDGDARRAREAYVVQAARDEGLETDVLRLDAADRSDPTPAAEAEADAATSDAAPRAAEGGGAAPRLRALDLEVAVDTEPERLPGAYRTRHLLVIGIDRYRHWNRLENARSDATAVAGVLQDRFGFTLSTALYDEEATRTAIEEAFIGGLVEGKGASGRVQADDLVVLFFAGHGQTERRAKDDAEIGFLVPWEAPRVGRSALLRMSTVREWTDDLAARHVLFIFDSCFSGLATTGGGGGGRPGFARRVITAGAPNQKVADGGDLWPNHSIFTGRLLHGLTEDSTLQRPILELELAGYLARHVPLDARRAGAPRQTPSYGALPSHGGDTIVLTEGPIG